jgi:hypothetical protein
MPTKQKIRARIVMCVSNFDLELGTQARDRNGETKLRRGTLVSA